MRLLLLQCPTCGTPLEAEPPDQVVACAHCTTHVALSENGLTPTVVRYAKPTDGDAGADRWEPIWVFEGQVTLRDRRAQSGGKGHGREAEKFWNAARRFYVPAGKLSAEQIRNLGRSLLQRQPPLEPLPAPPENVRMKPALLAAADAAQFAEFLVLELEARRKDMLANLRFDLQLTEPVLWAVASLEALQHA